MKDVMPNVELSKEEKATLRDINREMSKEERENTIFTSYVETENFILEQLGSATRATHATVATETKYIYYDKHTASIDYLEAFDYHGKTYKPIVDKIVLSGVVSLPSGIEEYGTTADLVKDIYDFLYENFEVPAFYEKFLPYIVLFSWVAEKFPFVPYLHFCGLTGTGKTTAAETIAGVCYKTIDAAGAITMSPIFRIADTWRGTLFLDEFEPEGDSYKEMLAFLKSGVGNRAVLRTEGDKKREVTPYLIKSMKIFTSERPINSAGLRSRMYVIEMQKSNRRIPLIKQQGFSDKTQLLRNKLLLWRLRHLGKIDLTEIEYGYPELSGFDRRVQQVLTPIYYLSEEKSRAAILEFAKVQELETKRERLESLEGEIFQAIVDGLPYDPTLKAITEKVNSDRGRKPMTEKRVANFVRQTLQFEIRRMGHENVSTILVSEKPDRLESLIGYFGVLPPDLGVARVASDANTNFEAKVEDETATLENVATRPNDLPYYSDVED